MHKLLILIIVFLLTTIHNYPQRNEIIKRENTNSERISRIEREPSRGTQIIYPKTGDIVKTRNPETITYPKTPLQPTPKQTVRPVVENCQIDCIVVSPAYDTPPPVPENLSAMELFSSGDYWEASRAFTRWLVNNPYDISALFYRGRCYIELEWYGFAIEDFNLVIDLDSVYADAYYYRGLAWFFRNEKELAQINFEIAYELDHKIAGIILKKYF